MKTPRPQSVPVFASVTRVVANLIRGLSFPGVVFAGLFFAMSLTPSLVPRETLPQGVLSGLCAFLGYALGVLLDWIVTYLQLPSLQRLPRWVRVSGCSGSGAIGLACLYHSEDWQNAVRSVMNMAPVDGGHPLKIFGVAIVVCTILLAMSRSALWLARRIDRQIVRFVPRRLAMLSAYLLTGIVLWSLANDLLVRNVFRLLDSSYRQLDARFEPERPQPLASGKTGSAASLIEWQKLGRAGREFVASEAMPDDIARLAGTPAREPIRVYVGLPSGETVEDRARLALEELKRQGGFERAYLVIVTPTGTGWIDPASMDALEYLTGGDVASVAVQYSYLSSPLSLLAQQEYGSETAKALFSTIYGYWTGLPKDKRPKLYLHGLSLGAMNSQISAELFEMLGDPVQGALWSGPPFVSGTWAWLTRQRASGTPERLPEFRDGRLVRFMNQQGFSVPDERPWGSTRVVYLQYASDPIVFFDYRSFFRRPDWMREPRGPDVSPAMRWYPIVTGFQLTLDMLVAAATPAGYGHVYAVSHYVDAWHATLGLDDWSPQRRAALKAHLSSLQLRPNGGG